MSRGLTRDGQIRVRASCEGCRPEYRRRRVFDRIVWAEPDETYTSVRRECQRCREVTTWRLGGSVLPGERVPGELPGGGPRG